MRRRNRRSNSRVGLRHIGQLLPELMIDLQQSESAEMDNSVEEQKQAPLMPLPPTSNPQGTFAFYSTVETV